MLPLLVYAQKRTDLKQLYGNATGEVYRTSNGLKVTAYFDDDGNICREQIESQNRGTRMTDNEVNTVLDEIAPKNRREEDRALSGNDTMSTFPRAFQPQDLLVKAVPSDAPQRMMDCVCTGCGARDGITSR